MTEPRDPDEELMDELRSVIDRVDPVPPVVTEFARAALGWRRLDADLAELLADSVLETESTALTRSGGATRALTFRAADLTIDIEIEPDGEARTILGQLAPPPGAATVEVQTADGTVATTAEANALGRFRLALEQGGRIRFRILRRDPEAAPVESSWLSL